MTISEFEEVIKSLEVSAYEDKDGLSVMLKGRFVDVNGREHGVLRPIRYMKCPVKGVKGQKSFVQMCYEGRQVYDASFGDIRDAECVQR